MRVVTAVVFLTVGCAGSTALGGGMYVAKCESGERGSCAAAARSRCGDQPFSVADETDEQGTRRMTFRCVHVASDPVVTANSEDAPTGSRVLEVVGSGLSAFGSGLQQNSEQSAGSCTLNSHCGPGAVCVFASRGATQGTCGRTR